MMDVAALAQLLRETANHQRPPRATWRRSSTLSSRPRELGERDPPAFPAMRQLLLALAAPFPERQETK